jgi:hypothetical protein
VVVAIEAKAVGEPGPVVEKAKVEVIGYVLNATGGELKKSGFDNE